MTGNGGGDFSLDDRVAQINPEYLPRGLPAIRDLGDGYRALTVLDLEYIELPEGHPDIGVSYHDLDPAVNCGLSYGAGRVFGWDYCHYENHGTPEGDIENALAYFRGRAKA